MSEEMAGDAAPQATGNAVVEENTQTVDSGKAESTGAVQYETHKRTVAKLKNWQQKAESLEERLNSVEQDKLAAEGKKDELIENLRKSNLEKDQRLKSTLGNFAYSSLTNQLETQAVSAGCVDVKALSKLVDLAGVSVDDETFVADADQLKGLVDDAKRNMPYLFSKPGPKINTRSPGGPGSVDSGGADYSKMSMDEIMDEAAKLDGLSRKGAF